jgi:hypothetical protein
MVAVGVLSALGCAGFWPGQKPAILGISVAVGLLLLPAAAILLPPYSRWMPPFLSLAGGASVAISVVRSSQQPSHQGDSRRVALRTENESSPENTR